MIKIIGAKGSIKSVDDFLMKISKFSKDNKIITSWSDDGGNTWDKMSPTTLPNPNSGTDAVTLSNEWQLLVYNHQTKKGNQWGGKRSPLNVAVSKDGLNWRALYELENKKGEYSYPAVIQSKDGMVHITYTWKREKVKYAVLNISDIDFKDLREIKGDWPE